MLTNQFPGSRTILKISELNAEVALLLQSGFPVLWVEGEISNLARPASGHLYFSLKDNKAQVRCAMFKNKNRLLRLRPENGIKVLARVKAGLYEPRGDFQLIVEHMEDAGAGQLQQAFEALKSKLKQAGLFDPSTKKPIPAMPARIGIITSPSGAAIQDVIHVLQRRSPHIPLLIYPTAVQGAQATASIVKAIKQADHDQRCDVLLLVRGGGSIEDLWCFNEEAVAQAIFSACTPIVTGVGHEIDFTIADFVSDQRAPTPSAAAELISPDKAEMDNALTSLVTRMHRLMQQRVTAWGNKLEHLNHRLLQQNRLTKIQQYKQRIDELSAQLSRNLQQQLTARKIALLQQQQRLASCSPAHQLKTQRQHTQNLQQRLTTNIKHRHQQSTERLHSLTARLNAISPLATLSRGYAIVRKHEEVIASVKQVKEDDQLNVLLAEGNFDCRVTRRHTK